MWKKKSSVPKDKYFLNVKLFYPHFINPHKTLDHVAKWSKYDQNISLQIATFNF